MEYGGPYLESECTFHLPRISRLDISRFCHSHDIISKKKTPNPSDKQRERENARVKRCCPNFRISFIHPSAIRQAAARLPVLLLLQDQRKLKKKKETSLFPASLTSTTSKTASRSRRLFNLILFIMGFVDYVLLGLTHPVSSDFICLLFSFCLLSSFFFLQHFLPLSPS